MANPSNTKVPALRPVWVLLGLMIVAAPLALGGVEPWAQAPLGLMAGGLLVLHSRARRSQRRRIAPGPVPAVLAVGGAWSLLQAAPLPRWLLALIAPRAAELWEVMTPDGGWGSLSPEPLETATTACALFTVAAVAAVTLDLSRQLGSRQRLLWLVWTAAALVLAVGTLQTALGVIGPYDTFPAPSLTVFKGTFVNPNHNAALMVLGVFAALGLAMEAQSRDAQFALGGTALAFAVTAYLCGSNGALVGTVAGLVLTTLMAWRMVRASRTATLAEEIPRRGTRAAALLALALAVPLALLATSGPDLLGIQQAALAAWELKQETIAESARAIGDFWLTGLGRGAYADVFPRFKVSVRPYTFVSPENLEVLLLLEWGIPFALAYMAMMAWWVGRCALKARNVVGAAACGGLAALWLHNQVDFNLETLGLALPWCAMLGAARPGSGVQTDTDEERRQQARTSTAWALRWGLLMALLGWLPAFRAITHDIVPSRQRALGQSLDARGEALEVHLRRHPTDYLAAITLSRLFRVQEPPDYTAALMWINRAMFLYPLFPDTHLDAGRILWALGKRSQAALEFGQAKRLPSTTPYNGLPDELIRRGLTVEELWEVFGADGRAGVCSWMDGLGRLGEAERCFRRLAELEPHNVTVMMALALRALQVGDLEEAEAHADDAMREQPGAGQPALVMAQVLYAEGRIDDANQFLDDARKARADPVEVDRVRFDRAMQVSDFERARWVLAELNASLQVRGLPLHEVMMREARLEEKAGNLTEALTQYRNAARANPTDSAGALNAARLAIAQGHSDLAINILREASATAPQPQYIQLLNQLEGGRVRH